MAIVSNGPITINRGVPITIFNAVAGQLPGLFSGKIRPQSLVDPTDTVRVELIGRTSGNVTDDVEVDDVMKFTDLRYYLTPLKATGKYEIRVTLENTSASASIPLDYEVDREASP